jgi:hypothetical protein
MWIIIAWQCIPPDMMVKGFIDVLYIQCSEWGLMIIYSGMELKRMGIFGVSVRKKRALTVLMETVTLICKGRQNLMFFLY